MTTRREALGLIGLAPPAWAFAARSRPDQELPAVSVGDPSIKVIANVGIPVQDGSRLAARLSETLARQHRCADCSMRLH
jgi:hypothetical protein